MNVHTSRVADYIAQGYVLVDTERDRANLEHPDKTCLRIMGHGRPCLLDKDHRGRCSNVVFYCDSCGKRRRGAQGASAAFDIDGVKEVEFCWFCVNVTYPAYDSMRAPRRKKHKNG